MDIDFNIPTIITKRNTDTSGSPISVKLIEVRQVMDSYNCIVLTQIPDELHRIYIEGFTEVFDIERLDKKNFKVDYNQGIIYFHPFNVGKTVSIEYYGTGYELISASRVFTKVDKYGNIIDTLESILERSDLQLKLIESLGGAIKVIEKLDENIKNANNLNAYFDEKIPEATELKNELDTIVTDAKGWKDQLKQDVEDGKILQPLLHNDIIQGNATKEQLEQSIANAQDDIAIIEATGNEIVNIISSEWIYNDTSGMYEKQIAHSCNSENVHVTCKTSDTKEALFLPWKIVDKSNILLKSDEAINVSVVISARYYKPLIDNTTTQEVIDARKGELTLKDKIDKIDGNIAINHNKLNYLLNGSIIIENDVEKLNSLLRTGKGIRYGVLGDSLEVGIGNVGQSSYGEAEYMWYYSANDLLALSLIESDINFIKCSNDVYTTYSAGMGSLYFPLPTHQIKKSDNAIISYSLKQNQMYKQDKLTIYFLERTHDEAARFDVVVNGTSIAYVDTYVPPITLDNGNSVNVIGRLGKFTVNIPAENNVQITIKNVRAIDRGNGISENALAVICGFSFGYGVTYRNLAVASMTAENDSDLNITSGVTTDGQLSKLYSIYPNVVGIGFGTNDSRTGTSASLIKAYKNNMRNIIDKIRSKNANTIIILFSAPIGEVGSGYEFNQIYFNALKEVAIEKMVNFIDVYEICKLSSRNDIMHDHIHLNSIGYQLKAEAIRKAFKLQPFSIGGATISNTSETPTADSVEVNGVSFSTPNTWETFMTLTLRKPSDKNKLIMMAKIPLESESDIKSHLKLFLNGVEMDYTLAQATATSGTRLVYATLMRHYTTGNSASYTVEVRGKDYTVATYSTASPNKARLIAYWV